MNLFEGKKDKNIFKAVFLIGSPASGKTETYKATLRGKGLKHLDPDKVMSYFVKKEGGTLKDTSAYSKHQERISKTMKGLTDNYIKGRLGLVIDGTGRDKSLISRIKNELESIGYQTAMIYINTPVTQALKRYKERERAVDKDFLLKARRDVKKNVPDYKNMFSNFFELNDFSEVNVIEKRINRFLESPLTIKARKWMNENTRNVETILYEMAKELLEASAGRTLFHYTNAYSFLLILEDGFIKTSGPYKFNKEKFEKDFGKDATSLYVTRPSSVPKNSLPMGLTGGVGPVRFIFDAQGISDNLRDTRINLLGGRKEELIIRRKEKNIPLNKKYLKIELLPDFTEKIKGYIPVKMKLEEYRKRLKKVYPKWEHLIIDNEEKKKLEEFLA